MKGISGFSRESRKLEDFFGICTERAGFSAAGQSQAYSDRSNNTTPSYANGVPGKMQYHRLQDHSAEPMEHSADAKLALPPQTITNASRA